MKKTLLSLLFVASCQTAMANEHFTGGFLGGELSSTKQSFSIPYSELGYSSYYDRYQGNYTADSSRSTGIGIFGGYSFDFAGDFVGAVEGTLRSGGATTKDKNGERVTKELFNVGVAYLQGYRINNVLPYVKVGVEASGFDLKDLPISSSSYSQQTEDSFAAWGIGYGAGVRYAFNENIESGLEYRKVNLRGNASSVNDGKVKIKSNSTALKVAYRF